MNQAGLRVSFAVPHPDGSAALRQVRYSGRRRPEPQLVISSTTFRPLSLLLKCSASITRDMQRLISEGRRGPSLSWDGTGLLADATKTSRTGASVSRPASSSLMRPDVEYFERCSTVYAQS